jgi:hypothetical protein
MFDFWPPFEKYRSAGSAPTFLKLRTTVRAWPFSTKPITGGAIHARFPIFALSILIIAANNAVQRTKANMKPGDNSRSKPFLLQRTMIDLAHPKLGASRHTVKPLVTPHVGAPMT